MKAQKTVLFILMVTTLAVIISGCPQASAPEVTYKVTFDANGGSGEMKAQVFTASIASPLTANTFSRDGYTFKNWNVKSDGNGVSFENRGPYTATANTILYAQWIPDITTYSVYFDANGGTGTIEPFVGKSNGETIILPDSSEVIAPSGYYFAGWNTTSTGTGEKYTAGTTYTITMTTTLYAQWSNTQTFSVLFDSQGGSTVVSMTGIVSGLKITKPTDPVRTGYTFEGWYKEASCLNKWDFESDYISTNTTLFAKWASQSVSSFIVSFDANGGSGTMSSQKFSTGITKKLVKNTFTKTGFFFLEWNTIVDGSGSSYADEAIFTIGSKNVTLYAQWSNVQTYSVVFDSQGGSDIASKTGITSGSIISKPSNPSKTGHTFAGWYKELDCINEWSFERDTIIASITLYAKWTANSYTVTFDANGVGTGDMPPQTFTYGIPQDLDRNMFYYTNRYKFVGWNTEADGSGTSYADMASFTIGLENVILYAQCLEYCRVSFYTNDGSFVLSMPNVLPGSKISEPTQPTKTGYTFAGWFKDSKCTTEWIFAQDIVTETITLYAKWIVNTYTLTFDANGGAGTMPPQEFTYNVEQKLIRVTFTSTQSGYTFNVWNTEPDGSGTYYYDEGKFKISAKNTTLYAVWKPFTLKLISGNDYEITAVNNKHTLPEDLVIPAQIDGKNIIKIGQNVFKNCTAIKSLTIPSNITCISESAFDDCTELTRIHVNANLTTQYNINNIYFRNSGNSSGCTVTFGSEVTTIPPTLFVDSNITTVIFPETITSIGRNAFSDCNSLTTLTIPQSVTNIGGNAFSGCIGLTSIHYSASITDSPLSFIFISTGNQSGCSVTFGSNVTDIPANIFSGSYITSVTIPETINSIGERAFSECNGLTTLSIPQSVTEIGEQAFGLCKNLIFIDFDANLTTNNSIFGGSGSETGCSVTIGRSVTKIADKLFSGANITSVSIPFNVTSIGDDAFSSCSLLTAIEIPASVTSIGNGAFSRAAGLVSITIPSGITSIEDFTFYKCRGLQAVNIPSSVTNIGNYAFSECVELTSINMPQDVTNIGEYAFNKCSGLTSKVINLPQKLKTLGRSAFSYCTELTTITIPTSVTTINQAAFFGCSSLLEIIVNPKTPPKLEDGNTLGLTPADLKIKVPALSLNTYKTALIWSNYKDRIISQ